MTEDIDPSFLASMFRASVGTNAANYLDQLQKRKLQFSNDPTSLGWVDHSAPNTVNLNALYKTSDEGRRPIAPRALGTALHEMFHSQDLMNGRTIGEYGAVDEAKHLLSNELSKDPNAPWNPGYSPYTEGITRLREDDMKLPQGESILNDPRVQKYLNDAFQKSRYNDILSKEETRPTRFEAFKKAVQTGMYPEQRWIEPREPTIKESLQDWINKLLNRK